VLCLCCVELCLYAGIVGVDPWHMEAMAVTAGPIEA